MKAVFILPRPPHRCCARGMSQPIHAGKSRLGTVEATSCKKSSCSRQTAYAGMERG